MTEEQHQQQMMAAMFQMMQQPQGEDGASGLQQTLAQMMQSRHFDDEEQALEWQSHVIAVYTQMQTQQQYEVLSEMNKTLQLAEQVNPTTGVEDSLSKLYKV